MELKCQTNWVISIICKMHLPMGLPHSCAFADNHQCKEEAQKWRWSRSNRSSVSLPWTWCLFREHLEDRKTKKPCRLVELTVTSFNVIKRGQSWHGFPMMWYWKPQDKKTKKKSLLFNSTTQNSASTKRTRLLTHCKLPGNAIWSLLVPSLLSLQLGQEAPQCPGLMLHGWLYSTLPGIGHLSQACQDTKVLVHGSWIATAWGWGRWHFCCCYTEHFSIATVTSRNYCEGERVNCLRGSKSKLTGSAVRWILSPRPLGVSHWVLKSPGCLIAWVFGEGMVQETPTNREGNTFYAYELTQTAVPAQSQSCSAGSLACWTTFRSHERSGGGMWLGVEAETEGVVKRGVSKNPENPDVLSQQLAATHSHVCVFIYAYCCFGERHLTIITQ